MGNKRKALVTGSGDGLGWHIANELAKYDYDIIAYDRKNGLDVRAPQNIPQRLDVLVNCAGVNKINWLENVTEDDWDEVMDINVKGMFLMSQACAPALKASKGTIVNIVSNASHMPMRCSAAYNASKGAAAILTKQLARELAPDVTVFAVSPNKLRDTGMSHDIDRQVVETRGWTIEEAQRYQLQGLLSGMETDPFRCAEFICFLLSTKERHIYLTGTDIPYGA